MVKQSGGEIERKQKALWEKKSYRSTISTNLGMRNSYFQYCAALFSGYFLDVFSLHFFVHTCVLSQ